MWAVFQTVLFAVADRRNNQGNDMRRLKRAAALFSLVILFPVQPLHAHASPAVLVNSQLIAAIQAVSGPNACIRFTYDLNGNRKTQTSSVFGAPGVTWGSAVYGCFGWTS
jgi:hypothetical protein